MSNTNSKIKELFASMSKAEQIETIKELSSNTETSVSIADFAIRHQKEFGENIEFSVSQEGADHAPTITVIVHTSFGDFSGEGSNQKIAKANAIEMANSNWV